MPERFIFAAFFVPKIGLKPSASGETFRSTSCGFQKIIWEAQTDSKGEAFGRGGEEFPKGNPFERFPFGVLFGYFLHEQKVTARRGLSGKLKIISC